MDMLDEVKDLRSEYKFRKLVKSYRKKLERAIFGSILYLITFLTENNVGTPEEVVELNADACVELKNSKVNEEINLDIKDSSENDIFVLANEGTDIISDNQSSSNSPNTKKDLKNICPIVKSISTLEPRLDENSNSSPEIITVINKSDNVNIGNVVGSAGIDRTLPVHVFLAKLPLSWIEKVVCADQLFIRSEFDRYQLLKKILDLRHSTNDSELFIDNLTTAHDEKAIGSLAASGDTSEGEDIAIESNDEDRLEIESGNGSLDQKKECNLKEGNEKKPFNSIFNMIDKFLPLRKKRKLDSDEEEPPIHMDKTRRKIKKISRKTQIQSNTISTVQPQAATLPKTLTNIYNTGIIYTWMTFPQLGIVKKDEMVPFNLALESYWLQAELGLSTQQKALPKFRFAVKFSNLSRDLELYKTITSDSFECAGVFFRVVLNMDNDGVKCLLQKSVGKISDISYKIWCFDQRFGVDCGDLDVEPCTECKLDEEGFANVVPSLMVKNEECESDSVFLVACVSFGK